MATHHVESGGTFPALETGKQVSQNGYTHFLRYAVDLSVAAASHMYFDIFVPREETWFLEWIKLTTDKDFDEMIVERNRQYRGTVLAAGDLESWSRNSVWDEGLILSHIAEVGGEWVAVAAGGELGDARGANYGELVSPLSIRDDRIRIWCNNREAGIAATVAFRWFLGVTRFGPAASKGESQQVNFSVI